MDTLYVLFDRLVTYPLFISSRRCKLLSPDGAQAYCVPSRKYRAKARFAAVCPLVAPNHLNPLTLGECLCSEGPARSALGSQAPPAWEASSGESQAEVEVLSDRRLEVIATKTLRGPGDWLTLETSVRNRGPGSLSYATLEVEYLDEHGEIVTRNLSVLGQLGCDESRTLRLSKKVPSFASCRVRFRNVR